MSAIQNQKRSEIPKTPGISEIPEICGFGCPHANFPPAETAGICRTMSAVWCGTLRELVNKNTPCEWRRRQKRAEAAGASRKPKPARDAGRRPRS